MTTNYKNCYDLSEYEQAIFAAQRKVKEAETNVLKAKQAYQEKCAKQIGVKIEDLIFSNICCMAKNISAHIYHIKVKYSPHGHHENKCIFCGLDNMDDLY